MGAGSRGDNYGIGIGIWANGTDRGIALGRNSNTGAGIGNIAMYTGLGDDKATIGFGFANTTEIGNGNAWYNGGFHYNGNLIIDKKGNLMLNSTKNMTGYNLNLTYNLQVNKNITNTNSTLGIRFCGDEYMLIGDMGVASC
jgi:hypothetical protein